MIGFILLIPISSIKANDVDCSVVQVNENFYMETIIYEKNVTRSTKSGTKTVNYRNAAGTIVWSVSVHGNFTYNGNTSSCTSSTVSTTCPSNVWKIISKSSSKSNNTAIGRATAKLYSNGIPIQTLSREVRLSCSSSVKLS